MSRLEEVLERYIEHSEAAMAAVREEVAEIRAQQVRFDQEVLQMRRESEARWKRFDQDRKESEDRWKKFEEQAEKDRQQAEKDRQQAEKDRQQAEKDRRDFNKRMAEIADRVGRFVEDMVHPNASRIAGKLFVGDPIETLAIRVKRRHPQEPSRIIEVDLLVAGSHHLLIGEAKSTPTVEKTNAFLEKVSEVAEFFPEYARHRVLPLLASVSFDPSLVAYLSRQKVYALGFGDHTMELLNEGAF